MLVQMWRREAGVVAFRTVTLVQMWCRYKFKIVVFSGAKQAVVALRTQIEVGKKRENCKSNSRK